MMNVLYLISEDLSYNSPDSQKETSFAFWAVSGQDNQPVYVVLPDTFGEEVLTPCQSTDVFDSQMFD